MQPHLFPPGDHLPAWARGLYLLCAVLGMVVLAFALFFIVVEVTTSPRATTFGVSVAVTSALFAAAHVVLEARSTKPLSGLRWGVFALAIAVFAYELWSSVNDPTARKVFLGMLGVGAAALLVARILITRKWSSGRGRS